MKSITKLLKLAMAGLAAAWLYGGAAFALPTISNVYPNGTNMFQPAPALTFAANSGTGVTNVAVSLTAQDLYTGQSLLSQFTSASGLTIAGSNVSAPLSSNKLYSATITVYDVSGSTTLSETFDTISPAYTWDAEDWDYTTNGNSGLFIDNPQVNQYAGLATSANDAYNNNGPGTYRPVGTSANPSGLATEVTGDSPKRLAYIGTTNVDYDVGWTDGGDWGDWTRSYPSGTYVLFARVGGGSGPQTQSADLSVVAGNATISSPASGPYKYGVKGRGWQNYDFMPVTDSGGNLVQITFDGTPSTLRFTQVQASDNLQFFMLMPVPPVLVSTVTITNVTPDGSVQFQASNVLSFTASSTVAINPSSNISVQLAATNLFGAGSVALLKPGSGLSYTGTSANLTVTAPLTTNMVYTALIIVNDANGIPASYTATFDTIIPYYTFEAVDWNYGGGSFFDNPQTNAYAGLAGVAEIDFHRPNGSTGGSSYGRVGLQNEGCGDLLRDSHAGFQDYDIGNTTGGDWADYTRTFPANVYNLFVRVATANGSVTDAGKISLVTSDPTQSGQTIQDLGKHNTPTSGGWQKYEWEPVINSGGYPARFVADGTPKTLRYTEDNAGDNIHFFMLMPADLSINPPPFVNGFTPDGTSLFQPSNTMTFIANSSVGIPQANVVVNLNGAKVSNLTFSGSSTLWHVSCPVQTNGVYTAIITLTDTAGTTKYTNSFTTLDASDYQWEAEDYDYGSGQYYDNPQVDAYAGLAGVPGVDYVESDPNGPGRSSGNPYRPANGANIPDTGAGDQARSQFTAVGGTDYSIGSFGVGSWANYTRHYPSGTYNVVGRFAEGAGVAGANLALITNGVGTNLLGTFTIQNLGWGTWQWQELIDTNGNPVKVALDGSAQILRLGGTTGNEVNVNFLMLVRTIPTPKLTATAGHGNITVSFATQTGYSYQLLYKNNLTDATWTAVGGPLAGNNAVQSAGDTTGTGSSHRFYCVQVQ